MKKKIYFIAILLMPMAAQAAINFDKAKGKTEFLAVVKPTGIRINGTGDGPEGTLELKKEADQLVLNGTFEVDISSFDTGMSMRNNHMKDKYLEVEKFPKAKLSVNDVKVADQLFLKENTLEFTAQLNLHGTDKPVQVVMTLTPQGEQLKTVAKFNIKISEFNIEKPTFAGLIVSDEIQVTTEVQIAKAELDSNK